jgi:hypothetical protein
MSKAESRVDARLKRTELALVAMVLLGCWFKIMHWPGATALIVLGGGLLALFYFPFGFRTLPAPKPTDQLLWMTVLAGASLAVALLGQVAFLQRWSLNHLWLQAGMLGCGLALLTGLVLRRKHPRLDIYLDGLLIRCAVLGGLAFMLWWLYSGKPR